MEDTKTAYSELFAYLNAGKDKTERPWGNNTRVRQAFDHIIVRLHNTEVAHVRPDGRITLTTGGWLTPTTKDRLNKVLALGDGHWRVWSEKGMWVLNYFTPGDFTEKRPIPTYAWADGVTVWPDGRIEGQGAEPPTKLRKAAKNYVNKLVAALFDGSLPAPDTGDCWYCRGIFGEVGERDDDHIKSHIEDGYLVPTLLWNVIVDATAKIGLAPRDYAQEILWRHGGKRYAYLDDITSRQLKRAVWVYIATRIGLPTEEEFAIYAGTLIFEHNEPCVLCFIQLRRIANTRPAAKSARTCTFSGGGVAEILPLSNHIQPKEKRHDAQTYNRTLAAACRTRLRRLPRQPG